MFDACRNYNHFFLSQVYRFSSKQSARSAFRCRDKWVNSICLWSIPEFPFDFVHVEQLFRFPPSFTSCAFSSSPRVRYNMIVMIICCCYRWLSCHQFLTLSTPSLVIVSWLNWEMRGSLAILVRLGVRSWWTSLILLQFYYWQKLKFLKYTNLSVVIGGQWIRFIALEIVVLFSQSTKSIVSHTQTHLARQCKPMKSVVNVFCQIYTIVIFNMLECSQEESF